MTRRVLAALLALVLFARPAAAQTGSSSPTVQLQSRAASGSITANGGTVVLTNAGGMASALIQTTGTFNLTWELECAADAAGTAFDTDDEIPVTLVSSSPVPSDTVATNVAGLYTANISGCTAVQVIATAYTSGTMGVTISAISSGGSSGGGGGAGSSVSIVQGGNTAAVNASSQLSVTCANCSGSGVSANEDTAGADGMATTPASTRRQDTLATDTSTDGDIQVTKSDAQGRVYTTGTGGTFPVSGVAATDAAVSGNPVYTAGRASAAAPTDVSADGDVVPFWLLRSGAQAVQPTFAGVLATTGNGASGTGVQRVTLANDSTGVIATVSTVTSVTNVATIGTSVTPGTAAANLGKAEDAVVGSGDTGVAVLGQLQATPSASAADGDYGTFKLDALGKAWIAGAYPEDLASANADPVVAMGTRRTDTAASSAGTDGDYANLISDANGRVWANIFGVTQAAGTFLTVRLSDGSNFLTPTVDATHDSAASATGPQVMAEATTSLGSDTAVADGDATRVKADINGRVIDILGCNRESRFKGYLTNTDGASTAVTGAGAPGANLYNEIWGIYFANSSATAVTVDVRDGTAGSVLATFMVPAGGSGGGVLQIPITQTVNTALAIDGSAAATTLYTTVVGCIVK